MKSLKRNSEDLFVCEECGTVCFKSDNLSRHVGLKHNKEEYFRKYLLEPSDYFCIHCGKEIPVKINFSNSNRSSFCSKKCQNLSLSDKKKKYSKNQKIEIEKKRKKTCIENFGEDNPVKSKKIRKKIEKTCFQRFGVNNYFRSSKFKEDLNTRMNSIHSKNKFQNTDLYYQSSYELDFLEKYYNKLDIKNGLTFFYTLNGEEKRYYSDFFIPGLNLIIEIKSYYFYRKFLGQNMQKKYSAEKKGYNFLFIIDKKYNKLEEYYE